MNSFQDVIIALKERQDIVLKYSPQAQKARNVEITSSTLKIAENLHKIKDDIKRQFIADLLVGATRNWEGFQKIAEKPRFKQIQAINLEITFDLIITMTYKEDLQLQSYPLHQEIEQAKKKIIENLAFFEQVAGRNISSQMISEFFAYHSFYSYRQTSQNKKPILKGLSSYDGQRTYINLDGGDESSRVQTIVHEFSHNISRFGLKPIEIRKISPERNENLRINQQLVEAGDWIEVMLFNRASQIYDPFSLLLQYQMEDNLQE